MTEPVDLAAHRLEPELVALWAVRLQPWLDVVEGLDSPSAELLWRMTVELHTAAADLVATATQDACLAVVDWLWPRLQQPSGREDGWQTVEQWTSAALLSACARRLEQLAPEAGE